MKIGKIALAVACIYFAATVFVGCSSQTDDFDNESEIQAESESLSEEEEGARILWGGGNQHGKSGYSNSSGHHRRTPHSKGKFN